MEKTTIENLVANRRIVTTLDLINPINDYVVVGIYQEGTNQYRGDGTSYKDYAISIAELLGGGSVYTGSNGIALVGNDFQFASQNISQFTNDSGYITSAAIPITNNVIPKGNGTSIVDGTWEYSINDLIPTTDGSNIGGDSNRIGTMYMYGAIDFVNNLEFTDINSLPITKMTLTTSGNLGINVVPTTSRLHIVGRTSTSATYAARFQNSAASDILVIRNDGKASFNTATTVSWAQVHFGSTVNFSTNGANFNKQNTLIYPDTTGFWAAGDPNSLVLYNSEGSNIYYVNGNVNFAGHRFFTVPNGQGTPLLRMMVQENGRVGIGTAANTAVAQLHVQNTQDGIGTGIPSLYYNTTVGGILAQYQSVDGYKETFTEGVNLRGSFTNAGGFSQWTSSGRMSWKNFANTATHLWMDNSNGYIGIGSNYFAASAQLHVRGASATPVDFALKVENIAGTSMLYVRNDGKVSIGTATPLAKFHVLSVADGGSLFTINDGLFDVQLSGSLGQLRFNYGADIEFMMNPYPTAFNTSFRFKSRPAGVTGENGIEHTVKAFLTATVVGGFVNGETLFVDTQGTETGLIYGKRIQKGSSFTNANATFYPLVVLDGNSGFGTLLPTATIHGKGVSALSTDFVMRLDDSANTSLFNVSNNGQVNISSLQTSGTGSPPIGLVSGDLWLDTSGGGNPLVSIVP